MVASHKIKRLSLIPLAFPTWIRRKGLENFNRRDSSGKVYADANVEDYIQLPWTSITAIGVMFLAKKSAAILNLD